MKEFKAMVNALRICMYMYGSEHKLVLHFLMDGGCSYSENRLYLFTVKNEVPHLLV